MPRTELPEHVRALLRRGAYPRHTSRIDLVQTHGAYVFLLDDEVYKLKKAIDLGFFDFTTLEKRRIDSEAEVRLNQRGCPSTYLGVETVTRETDGSYRVGGEGEVVDYAVHMRRLPADRMMDRLVEADAVTLEMIGALVTRLVTMHEAAERSDRISRIGGYDAVTGNWHETLSALEAHVGRTLSRRSYERIRRYGEAFLQREEALIRSRAVGGWIRDCHGDLRCDSVCFDAAVPGGICLYDCIEFNERFRYGDTALDVAFLAMDLDNRGRADLSDLLIGLYVAAMGDEELPLLLHFFKCYRALVRAKVECLLMDDGEVARQQRSRARARARRYLQLAESYARHEPMTGVVLVMGASGSGKSVLAGALAARFGAVLLSTDMLRRETAVSDHQGSAADVDAGQYAPSQRALVYDELARRAEVYINQARAVVLDGTFIEEAQRRPVVAMTGAHGVPLTVIECIAPDDVVRRRQEQRRYQSWTTSEGRWDVYLAQKARYQPPQEVPEARRLRIDTTLSMGAQIEAAEQGMRRNP